jgi:hypothetical protein
MQAGTTLFQLRADGDGFFDGSNLGVRIARAVNAKPRAGGAAVTLAGGVIEIGRHKALDSLSSFTIEATVTPRTIGPERQNIVEAQSPGIALFMSPEGKLVGSLLINGSWQGLDSGNVRLEANTATTVRFTRDEAGKVELSIGDRVVATKTIAGAIQKAGDGGFKIGAWTDGKKWPFDGTISDLAIRTGAVPATYISSLRQKAQQIEASVSSVLRRVRVSLIPDESRARLLPIKDIMNAAGVERLSELQTLKITTRTVITKGMVLVAGKKAPTIDWSSIVNEFRAATKADKQKLLARTLTNQNSEKVLLKAVTSTAGGTTQPGAGPAITPIGTGTSLGGAAVVSAFGTQPGSAFGTTVTHVGTTASATPTAALARNLRDVARMRPDLLRTSPSEFIRLDGSQLKVDPALLTKVKDRNPINWVDTVAPQYHLLTLKTIPVNSAVIIAGELDLTNTELVVEPNVGTLYIIAEKMICGDNAAITWRRPSGTTPARQDDPSLNGRSWSGVHTKPNSRDGLDGENGRDGAAGLNGAPGAPAPNLEMWVKHMTGMPNLDFTGEDGRPGGAGQRGGRGGNGADGKVGERIWFFGWRCTSDPGDGGDGGNGGRGGAGGRGGNGGNGGKITIGVLEGTLTSTVTNKAFKIKNAGGRPGRGGAGGAGGLGGAGGRSGVGETCKDAEHGHPGAQGQPGPTGQDGFSAGIDGYVEFFEFSEDAWDELLTRPWVTEVAPVQAFPGDTVTLRGSRFTPQDQVFFDGEVVSHTIAPDESVQFTVPDDASGGAKTIYVQRSDGDESNRITAYVKPRLDTLPNALAPGAEVSIKGAAFLPDATVLINGAAAPATDVSATEIKFVMPGTDGTGSSGGSVTVQVRNPDGLVSNLRTAQIPRILEVPFKYGQHNLPFNNFSDGIPDWSTFEDTFGAAEVWHELLDSVFGHPVLTTAYFIFYKKFLKGKANGGYATGFCTSLSSFVADRFWQGRNDTITVTKDSIHKLLTAVHGKLLSRESLLHFHDQGRQGVDRVLRTYREIEATFLRGCDRHNAPLLFFIPSGAAWDSGYFDKLSDSHCIMPWRFVYPEGRVPTRDPTGTTTLTDPRDVELYCWDCNRSDSPNCRLKFFEEDGKIHYDYFVESTKKFSSKDGITLGMMRLGDYLLADHDLPFSGPFGLRRFIIDFLLSPADLEITDGAGRRTGNFGGQILAEIPDSHPCYLIPHCYLLPEDTALTRRIVGNATGQYSFHSILPQGGSLALENVSTQAGQADVLAVSADANQIRFTPAAEKTFALTLSRMVGTQARALAITGAGGGPAADVDITLSPDLSLLRVGNRGAARNVTVKAFSIDKATNTPANRQFATLNLPANHDLTVAVSNWTNLDAAVETLKFD